MLVCRLSLRCETLFSPAGGKQAMAAMASHDDMAVAASTPPLGIACGSSGVKVTALVSGMQFWELHSRRRLCFTSVPRNSPATAKPVSGTFPSSDSTTMVADAGQFGADLL